jgi:hypothetical protein
MPQLRNQLTVLDETLAIRLEFDVPLVPPEQIPFGKQQLAQESVSIDRIATQQEIFDPRLLAGTPRRFERVTNRIHIRSRRRRGGLFAR